MPRVFLARFDLSAADALAPAELSALAALLDPDEQRRAERFVRDGDRARFIVAHAGLRRCLGGALGCPPAAVRLRAAPGRKPELAPDMPRAASLSFNLAHSATVALVAWGDAPLGVDVEDIARDVDHRGVGALVFSPRERARLEAQPDVAAERADFYAAWTRKEALLKALGTGFDRDATVIDLVPHGEGIWSWQDPLTGVAWTVRDLDVGPAHKAALATLASPLEIVLTDVR